VVYCLVLQSALLCWLSLAFVVLFANFFFSVEVIASKPFKRPWLSIPEAFFRFGLPVYYFILAFIQTRGLIKLSPRVPARCSSSACVCTHAVLVTVAGLFGSFSAWVGQSSPPVVRRAPLRGIDSGAAQLAGWGILSLACVC
jgi:hypothetical protein